MQLPEGMSIGEAVARLYNRARPQGMGFLHFTPDPMSVAEADALIGTGGLHGDLERSGIAVVGRSRIAYLDYVKGRVMKVDVARIVDGREGWERLYERDNGSGSARDALTNPKFAPAA